MESIELEKVVILLDNDKINYQCGETIRGMVNIALNRELNLSRVNIVLRSMSEVKWMEIIGVKYYREGYTYRDHQQYLNVVYEIPDNIFENANIIGEHSIPFEFKLPDNIPSSVDTAYGYISYWIEVIINDDSLPRDVYRDRKYFTVESPFRSNLYLSVGGGTEKNIGVLFLGSGKVRIDAALKQKGHLKGETVEVHCLVTNTSTVAVTPRASFNQTQIFMAKETHKTVEYSSQPVVGDQVTAGQTREQIISVQIPTDISLSIKTQLISIKYFIHITLDIPHSIDLHLNLPIVITNEYALNNTNEATL